MISDILFDIPDNLNQSNDPPTTVLQATQKELEDYTQDSAYKNEYSEDDQKKIADFLVLLKKKIEERGKDIEDLLDRANALAQDLSSPAFTR